MEHDKWETAKDRNELSSEELARAHDPFLSDQQRAIREAITNPHQTKKRIRVEIATARIQKQLTRTRRLGYFLLFAGLVLTAVSAALILNSINMLEFPKIMAQTMINYNITAGIEMSVGIGAGVLSGLAFFGAVKAFTKSHRPEQSLNIRFGNNEEKNANNANNIWR